MQTATLRDGVRRARRGRRVVTDLAGYEIRVSGSLERRWWAWFEDFTVTIEPSDQTVLSGTPVDQRLLIGALVTLHELGHSLVSINQRSEESRQDRTR